MILFSQNFITPFILLWRLLVKRGFILFLIAIAISITIFNLTPLGFLLSTLSGIGSFILFKMFFNFVDKTKEEREASAPTKINAKKVVNDGINKLREISNKTRMISNNEVAHKIKEICKTGVEIFDYIKKNPEDVNRIRQFNLYYLDATKTIVLQYVELSSKKNKTAEMEETLKKVEEMLDNIRKTFSNQLENLYEDDLLDLNTEISLLKNTMKLEQ